MQKIYPIFKNALAQPYNLIIFAFQNFELIFRIRDVAQPGSVHVWGAWGRKFKSCHPDILKEDILTGVFFFFELMKPREAKWQCCSAKIVRVLPKLRDCHPDI